jgi:glutathionylspermidine synthase
VNTAVLHTEIVPGKEDQQTAIREWMFRTGIPVLPYSNGLPRYSPDAKILPTRQVRALYSAARSVGKAYDELSTIIANHPEFLKEYFSLTPLQEALWYTSSGMWRGISRADLFLTEDGSILAAELNSDTPSGMDEAFLLGQYAKEFSGHYHDPNAHLPKAFLTVIGHAMRSVRRPAHAGTPTIGIVYPTDIPEDMGLLHLYRRWLEQHGYDVTFGSPRNLRKNEEGRVTLYGNEIDVLLRHYKTDWWCEQISPWKGTQASADILPLVSPFHEIIEPMIDGHLAVVNPFGCILTQNKLTLAFFHEHRSLFSAETQKMIDAHIPFTVRLSQCDPQLLLTHKNDWVLKSNYGCEGAEVIIGCATEQTVWEASVNEAAAEYWIAQRYFHAAQQDGAVDNFGVFLAGSEPCGIYLRRDTGMTTAASGVVPVLERTLLAETHRTLGTGQSTAMRIDPAVERLLEAYTPDERWLPFRMPLILYSAAEPSLVEPFLPSIDLANAERLGASLSDIIASAPIAERTSLMMVCDLPGTLSVAAATGLSDAAGIVLQMENTPHPNEQVPLRRTLFALMQHAEKILAGHRSGIPSDERPPLFVLAQERLTRRRESGMDFNNRHWSYLPSSASLNERGITTVLYLHDDELEYEQDDLNETFLHYQQNGIRICSLALSSLQTSGDMPLNEMLRFSATTVQTRRTIFSIARQNAEKQ